MRNTIERFELMCKLTSQMVEAARSNDWDQLGTLEHEVAQLRDSLARDEYQGIVVQLSDEQRERKRNLILRMLDDDREIRKHTEPWMASVRRLLSNNSMKRSLQKTYNS